MKNKRGKLFKIFSLLTAITIAIWANGGLSFTLNNTVRAVGDLTVDWGVPTSGDPIFVVNNMAPGDTQDRNVEVTNDGSGIRPVGVRGVQTGGLGGLENVLEIIISEGGSDLYGGTNPGGVKTLQDFFTDSEGTEGVFLLNLSPSESKTLHFAVTFPFSAGNSFQATNVVFDLIIGISVEVPEECSGIEFDGEPIFGTSSGDRLTGTPGNDLIFGFEGGDKIEGNSGDDCLVGGDSGDRINGNAGNDVILGKEGNDQLKGNNGDDKLFGGEGSDSLDGENGEDVLEGGEGSDSLSGGNQDDILIGGNGSDSLKGGNGNDSLDDGAGSDTSNGGPGTDTCVDGPIINNCELP